MNTKEQNGTTGVGKTRFIFKLIDNGATRKKGVVISKLKAREAAQRVIRKFHDASLTPDEELKKALRMVRACNWHYRKANKIKSRWRSAYEDRKAA